MPFWEVAQWISAVPPRLEKRETWGTRCQLGLGIYLETHLLRFLIRPLRSWGSSEDGRTIPVVWP